MVSLFRLRYPDTSLREHTGSWIANVGAGVRIGNMALALYKQGKRALPHGTCPGVGIGGHATRKHS